MPNGNGINIPITATIEGYQASLEKFRKDLGKIDPGSAIGKSITTALEQAEDKVKKFSANPVRTIGSERQLGGLVSEAESVEEAIQRVQRLFTQVQAPDLNLSALGGEVQQILTQLEALNGDYTSRLNAGVQDAISSSEELKQKFADIGVDIEHMGAAGGMQEVTRQLSILAKEANDAEKAIEKATANLGEKQHARDAFYAQHFDAAKLGAFDTETFDKLISEQYTNFDFSGLRQTMQEQVTAAMSEIEVPPEMQTKVNEILSSIVDPQSARDAIAKLNEVFAETAIDTNQLSQKLEGSVTSSVTSVIERIKEHIRTLSPKDAESQIQTLLPFLNEENLRQALDKARKILSAGVDQLKTDATRLDSDVFKAEGTLKVASDRYTSINTRQAMVSSAGNALQETVDAQQKELATLRAEIESLKQQLQQATGRAAGEIQQTGRDKVPGNQFGTEQLKEYNAELDRAQQKEQMLGQLKGFAQRWFSVYAVIRMARQAMQSMVQTITELDKTITQISIVTSMSSDDLWKQMPQYTAMAQRFGASIAGVYEVSQLYYQQGLKTNEVMTLTAETLKMAQISGLDYATATNYMTNAIRSFKMEQEDASRVTDVYAALAASSASSVQELATAMSKTASSAQAVGTSFEETSAMMAVMIEATREAPENIGSAMKSIISRYGELKEAVDPNAVLGEGDETFSLNKVDKALQTVGISIHDAQGQFRGFGEVIAELSSIWNTLDSNTQRYIATIMAGNRQQSRFLALVSSGERYQELLGTAENSEDAGTLQQIKTMDSIETKTQQLKTAMESLYNTSGIQNWIKGWTELKTRIVETYASLTGKGIGGIAAALAKLGALFYNAANVTLTALNILRVKFAQQRKLIETTNAQESAREQEAIHKAMENDKTQITTNAAQQRAGSEVSAAQNSASQQTAIAQGSAGKKGGVLAKGSKGALAVGVGASLLSMVLQGSADQMGEATAGERTGKGVLTGLSTGLTGLSIGSMFGVPGMIIGGIGGLLVGLFQALDIIHEDDKERAARLEKEKNETENEAAEKRASYNTTKNDVKELEKLEQHRYDSVEAMQEYLDKSNELAEQIPELVKGYDAEGNAIIDLARSYDLLNDKKKEAADASAAAMDKAYEAAANATNTAKKNYDQKVSSWGKITNLSEMDEIGSEYAQSVIDIARENVGNGDYGRIHLQGGIGYSIRGTLKGLAFSDIEDDQYVYNDLIEGADQLNESWKQYLSGQIELEEFLSKYSNEILNAQDDGENFALTTMKKIVLSRRNTVNESEEKYQKAFRQEQALAKQNVMRFTNEQFIYSKMDKDFNEELINNLPNVQSIMSDYVLSVFNGITDEDQRNEFFKSGAGQTAYDTIWKQVNNYVTTDVQAKQLNSLIQNRSSMTEQMAKQMFLEIFGSSLNEGDPLYEAIMSYYKDTERYTSETFQKSLESRKNDKNATSFERDLADKVLQSNDIETAQQNWLTNLNDETAKAMSNYFQQLTANVEHGTMSEAAAQQAMAWRIYLADAMQDYIDEDGISIEEQQKRLALQSRVNELDWTDWTKIQFFLNDLSEEFGGVEKIPEFLYNSIMGLQLTTDVKNVASRVNTFNNTMSETFKTMSNDLDKITKGIDASDVFELMSKYGLSWSDFEEKQGQYFLKDPSEFIKKRYEAAQKTAADFSQQAGRIRNIEGVASVGERRGEGLGFGMVGIRRGENDNFVDINNSSRLIEDNDIINDAVDVINEAYDEEVLTNKQAQDMFNKYKASEISKKISFIEYIQNDLYQQAFQNKELAETLGTFTIGENGQITINSEGKYNSLQDKINNQIFTNVESNLNDLKKGPELTSGNIETQVSEIYSGYSESFKMLGISEADFTKYATEWLNSAEEEQSFWQYLAKKYEEASEESMAALRAAAKSQMKPLLNNGQIMEFINTAAAVGLLGDNITEKEKADIMEAILKGDLDFLKQYGELQTFYSDILNNAAKSQKDLFTQITDFTKGDMGKKYIMANDYNQGLLNILKSNNLVEDLQDGTYAILNGITEESFNTSVQQALEAGVISKEDAISLMSSFHNEQYKNNIYSVLSDAVKDINGMSQETAIRVADIFGNSLQEAINAGYIVLNELTGKYEFVDEGKIRDQILKSLPQSEERNKLLAELDKNDAESKRYKAYSDLTKNYDKLSEDMVAALATQLGWSYETLRAILVDNGDGTYKMSLSQMKGFVKAKYGDQIPKAIQDQIDAAEDGVLNGINSFAITGAKGYTNVADMRKIINSINDSNIFKDSVGMELFTWNDQLNAYVLSTNGMFAQMDVYYAQMETLSDEQKAIGMKLMRANAKTLAEAVKLTDLIGAQDGDPIWATTMESIKNYNAFVTKWNQLNQDNQEDQLSYINVTNKDALRQIINTGGQGAVSLLASVAKAQGTSLNKDDVARVYRAHAFNLIDNVDSALGESVGAVIDSSAVKILEQAGYHTKQLAGTEYSIITGIGNITQAYRLYLDELNKEISATASEINAAAARYAASAYGGGNVFDMLSDAGSTTWDDLGEFLAQYNVKLTSDMIDTLAKNGAVKSLGGKNIAIMDWNSLAKTLGIDMSDPIYTSAFSSYNDALIKMNREAENNITSELGKLGDIKGGDWINLTWFSDLLSNIQVSTLQPISGKGREITFETVSQDALTLLNSQLKEYGAQIDQGILKINAGANIPAIITEIISSAQQHGGLLASEIAELGDMLTKVLSNYIDLIDKGIQGTLTQSEAAQLSDWAQSAGIDLTFIKTAEGLKMSNQQAIMLYNEMKKIDEVAAESLWNKIVAGMKESVQIGKGIVNVFSEIAAINTEIQKLGEANNDIERTKLGILEAQLDVYKQIARERLTDSNAFKWMDESLDAGMQANLNFRNSMGSLTNVWKTAAKPGTVSMEAQDFFNSIDSLQRLATETGQDISYAGMTFNKGATTYEKYFNLGVQALKIDASGKTVIDLASLGPEISLNAANTKIENLNDGITEYAKKQVHLLDEVINVLKIAEKMEALEDVDVNGDMSISIAELFNGDTFSENAQTAIDGLITAADESKDVKEALEKYEINNHNLYDIFQILKKNNYNWNAEDVKKLGLSKEAMTGLMTAMLQFAKEDFNPEDLNSIMAKWSGIFNIPLPNTVISFENGGKVTYQINGKSYDTLKPNQALLESLGLEDFSTVLTNVVNEGQLAGQQLVLYRMYTTDVVLEKNEDDGTVTYKYGDKSFSFNPEDATSVNTREFLAIEQLKEMGFDDKGIHVYPNVMLPGGSIYVTATAGNFTIGINNDGNYAVAYNGQIYKGKTYEDAMQEMYKSVSQNYDYATGDWRTDFEFQTAIGLRANVKLTTESAKQIPSELRKEILAATDDKDLENLQIKLKKLGFTFDGFTSLDELKTAIGVTIEERNEQSAQTNYEAAQTQKTAVENFSAAVERFATVNSLNDGDRNILAALLKNPGNAEKIYGQTKSSGLWGLLGINDSNLNQAAQILTNLGFIDTTKTEQPQEQHEVTSGTPQTHKETSSDEKTENKNSVTESNVPQPAVRAVPVDKTVWPLTQEGRPQELSEEGVRQLAIDTTRGSSTNNIINEEQAKTLVEDMYRQVEDPFKAYKLSFDELQNNLKNQTLQDSVKILNEFQERFPLFSYNNLPTPEGIRYDSNTRQFVITEAIIEAEKTEITSESGIDKDNQSAEQPATPTVIEQVQQPTNGGSDIGNNRVNGIAKVEAPDTSDASKAMEQLSADAASTGEALNGMPFEETDNKIATTGQNLQTVGSQFDKLSGKLTKGLHTSATMKVDVTMSVKTDSNGVELTEVNGNSFHEQRGFTAAKGTLMGELGPELVVSNGHYFVAGQNGAEFVDLADDAIVFNHLQTQRLLGSGKSSRGRAVTNEKKATSYAKGNVNGGPAMASASAAIAQLKKIRSMWQNLVDAGISDLGKKAGGGGGGGNKDIGSFIADLDRWYTLMQKIAALEKQINYEEKLRTKILSDREINGNAYYESQKRSLAAIKSQASYEQQLADLQQDYLDHKVKDLENSFFGRIMKMDEESGMLIFNDEATMANGDHGGLRALGKLYETDEYGTPTYNAKQQVALLQAWGMDMNEIMYDTKGKKIELKKDEDYENVMKNFDEQLNARKDEIDELKDEVKERRETIINLDDKRNKILQEIIDNQRAVEDRVLKAVENIRQQEIDQAQDERDAIEDSAGKFLDGLSEQLDRERDMYETNDTQSETERMRRQLAILQRSGGSASEIKSLQDEIAQRDQDAYFDAQQRTIDAIQSASDKQIERLDHQIDLMTKALAYDKEHGLLWAEVYKVINASTPEQLVNYINANTPDNMSMSELAQLEETRKMSSEIERYFAYVKDAQMQEETDYNWEVFWNGIKGMPGASEHEDEIRQAYVRGYKTTDNPNKAGAAANEAMKVLMPKPEKPAEDNGSESKQEDTGAGGSEVGYLTHLAVSSSGQQVLSSGATYVVGAKVNPITPPSYLTLGGVKCKYQKNSGQITIKKGNNNTIIYTYYMLVEGNDLKRTNKQQNIAKYATGGLADYTGLAMVHGSKSKPEAFLNAEETQLWKNQILSSGGSNSLANLLLDFRNVLNNQPDYSSIGTSTDIGGITLNMNVASIANDYDVRQAADTAMDEILKIARKTSVNSIRR